MAREDLRWPEAVVVLLSLSLKGSRRAAMTAAEVERRLYLLSCASRRHSDVTRHQILRPRFSPPDLFRARFSLSAAPLTQSLPLLPLSYPYSSQLERQRCLLAPSNALLSRSLLSRVSKRRRSLSSTLSNSPRSRVTSGTLASRLVRRLHRR